MNWWMDLFDGCTCSKSGTFRFLSHFSLSRHFRFTSILFFSFFFLPLCSNWSYCTVYPRPTKTRFNRTSLMNPSVKGGEKSKPDFRTNRTTRLANRYPHLALFCFAPSAGWYSHLNFFLKFSIIESIRRHLTGGASSSSFAATSRITLIEDFLLATGANISR